MMKRIRIEPSKLVNPNSVDDLNLLINTISSYFGDSIDPMSVGLAVGYDGSRFCALVTRQEYENNRNYLTLFQPKRIYERELNRMLKKQNELPEYPNSYKFICPEDLSQERLSEVLDLLKSYEARFPEKEWGVGIHGARFTTYVFIDSETAKEWQKFFPRKRLEQLILGMK